MLFKLMFIVVALVSLGMQGVISTPFVVPENVNIDEILENEKLSNEYADCILDKKPCPPEGQKIKDAIPEALANKCAKCDEKVKANIKKVFIHYKNKKPDIYNQVVAKYDPNGSYSKELENLFKH